MIVITYIQELMQIVFEWVGRTGEMAPVYFTAVYALATFLFIPIVLLNAAGGLLFGIFPGAFLAAFGALLSSGIAYALSHYFLRSWVHAEIRKHRLLRVLDEVIKKGGWKIVMLSRLAPVFPFHPLNFVYGVSKIGYWKFIVFSFIGFLPGSFLYAYLGSIAGSFIGLQERTPLLGEKFFLAFSVLAAILATVYVTKLTRQAMAADAA